MRCGDISYKPFLAIDYILKCLVDINMRAAFNRLTNQVTGPI